MLTINGEKIDKALIENEVERIKPSYKRVFKDQTEEEQQEQLFTWAKENIIEQILMMQESRADQYAIADDEVEQELTKVKEEHGGEDKFFTLMNMSKEEEPRLKSGLEQKMRMANLMKDVCKDIVKPSADTAVKYYEKNIDKFVVPEQVHAAHIVKYVNNDQTQAQAYAAIQAVYKKLQEGSTFEEVAGLESDCADNNGDMGFFSRGQMVEEFEEVVFSMENGRVSDIIRTPYGYHIAKRYNYKKEEHIPFEKVKDEVIAYLYDDAKHKEMEKFVDVLKAKADIVDDDHNADAE